MAKKTYIGVGDKAKKVKKIYVGVDGKARRVKKAYVGVNGVAKLVYTAECVWSDPIYTWNTSGTLSCIATIQCVDCGLTQKAWAVNITPTVVTAATCSAQGTTKYTAYFSDSVSWAETQTTNVTTAINPNAHSYGTTSYDWSSDGKSCTATRTCSRNTSHKETATATVTGATKTAATCTTKGTTRYTATFAAAYSSWTSTQTKDVQDIAATGHAWSVSYSWSSDKSSCTATRKCGNNSSHNVTATGTVTSTVTKAATCIATGTRTYTATFSGTSWASTQTTTSTIAIDSTNHSAGWNAPTYSWNGTSSCTATRTCKNNTSHTQTSTATITSKVKTAATCTTKGTTTYTATFSASWASTQTKDAQDIAATGHTAGAAATCSSNQTCTVCGTQLAAKNPSNHSSKTSYAAKSPTCTASGNYAYSYCSGCQKYYNSSGTETTWSSIYRAATGHTAGAAATCTTTQTCTVCGTQLAAKNPNNHASITTLAAKAATCIATGLTEGKKCTACGTVTVAQQTVAKNASNHSGAGCTVTNAATASVCKKWSKCGASYDTSHNWQTTSTSSVCRTCKDCGYKDTSHNYDPCECSKCDYVLHGSAVAYPTVAATCTSTGLTGGTYCSDCGETFTARQVTPALNHPSKSTINYSAPSCTSTGYSGDTYCNTCKTILSYGSSLPKTDHDWVGKDDYLAPTCTTAGHEENHYCGHCGAQQAGATIPKWGHNWDPCECSNPGCNEVLHGTAKTYATVAATCTSDGQRGGTYCSDCSEELTAPTVIPALNHPNTGIINNVDADCTSTGYTGDTYCYTCRNIISYGSTIPKTSHSYSSSRDCICNNCGEDRHEYDNWDDCYCNRCGEDRHEWNSDCTCQNCGETNHNYVCQNDGYAPTCTSNGKEDTYKCTDCGDTYGGASIPRTGHDWDSYPYYDPCKCSNCGVVIHSWEDCTCADCGDHDDSWIDEDCYCSGCYEYFHQCTRYACTCEHCGWEDHTYGNSGECIYGCGSHDDSYENTDPDECLIASTPILMADGTEKAISEVRAGDMVKSWDLDNNEYIDVKVLGAYCTGKATDWSTHTFDNGQSVTVYNNHRIFCKENNGVKGSEEWRAGLTALAVDGVETKYEDVEARHDETTSQRYTMLTENNLYFANGILCGHHSKSKYKFFTKGWLKATPEEIAHYATTAGIYEDMEKAFTNEEYLKQAAPLREQLLKAKEDIRVYRHEIKKIDRDIKKRGRNRIDQKELFDMDDRRNGRIVEARRMKADSKSLRRELDELKTKFGITTKSKYQIWKETYDIDMEYLKSKR